ncbi:hypothetical protein I4F81_008403 [Pyropia yezoensis]|uniref:Uncharacterized protein n=1 Tax=Pyropia yezoensis TaxID=2788 RepID=A0ACC3C7B8_PYRYE|nr:hypothetical protein I4F81_008403 [Neopyropia yezoensis]
MCNAVTPKQRPERNRRKRTGAQAQRNASTQKAASTRRTHNSTQKRTHHYASTGSAIDAHKEHGRGARCSRKQRQSRSPSTQSPNSEHPARLHSGAAIGVEAPRSTPSTPAPHHPHPTPSAAEVPPSQSRRPRPAGGSRASGTVGRGLSVRHALVIGHLGQGGIDVVGRDDAISIATVVDDPSIDVTASGITCACCRTARSSPNSEVCVSTGIDAPRHRDRCPCETICVGVVLGTGVCTWSVA